MSHTTGFWNDEWKLRVICCQESFEDPVVSIDVRPFVWHHLCVSVNLVTGMSQVAMDNKVSVQ